MNEITVSGAVRLRNWKELDAERLAKIANNEKITANLGDRFPYPYGLADARAFVDSAASDKYMFAVEVNGQIEGSFMLMPQSDVYRRNVEISYFLSEALWGKGIMSVVLKSVCAFVFSQTEFTRIFAIPFVTNLGSRRALEKAGFTLDGVLRENVIKNGAVLDSCVYSLLKREFSKSPFLQ